MDLLEVTDLEMGSEQNRTGTYWDTEN